MSAYWFLAAEHELPELPNPKKRVITVREAMAQGIEPGWIPWEEMDSDSKLLCMESEDALDELEIRRDHRPYPDVQWYTTKPLIYTIEFRYTPRRLRKLHAYLLQNVPQGGSLEVWVIWQDERQDVIPTVCAAKDLAPQMLQRMFDYSGEPYSHHQGLLLQN